MQLWLSAWYGVAYSPQMTNGTQNQMDRLSEMSGADFEIMFLHAICCTNAN